MAAEQVLTLASAEPPNLDPHLVSNYTEIIPVMMLFDALVEVSKGQEFLPLTAAAWDVSADGTVYTFHIRPEAKWSDGSALTANDFDYSYKRLLDPATGSEVPFFAYDLVNGMEINTGANTDVNSLGVKAVDEGTFEITLKAPAAYILHVLALYSFPPVPQKAIEAHGEEWVEPPNMLSNGPFRLEKWEHDVEFVLARNENYWGEPAKLDQITFHVLTDSVPAYENDEVDVSLSVGSADIDQIQSDATLSKEIQRWTQSLTNFLVFDNSNTDSPISKPEIHQALYLATDRDTLTKNVLKGLYEPAPLLLPPGMPGRNEAGIPTGGVDHAKELLAGAGFPDGKDFPEITLNFAQGPIADLVVQVLQQMWKDNLNVNLKLNSMEVQAYRAWFASLADAAVKFDMYFTGNGSDYNDPQNWHNLIWQSDQGDFYHMRWVNAEFDTLVKQAVFEQDPTKRIGLYEQADLLLMQDMPAMPLYYGANNRLVKPYVRDLEWMLITTDRFLHKVWIAEH